MRVICCYSGDIHPKAAEALKLYAPDCEYVETKGLFGYNLAIASRWTGESDLVVIEADKEITADVIPAFEGCDHWWCCYSYDVFPAPYTKEVDIGLGCTRYSATVQKLVKPEEFLGPDPDCLPKCPRCKGMGCWVYLDSRIGFAIMNRLIKVEVHGKLKHHHEYAPDWAEKLGIGRKDERPGDRGSKS